MIKKKITIYLLISIAFVLFFSYSTVLFIGHNDSIVFLTIGKLWSKGVLPYKELFDHKGPLVFFINMVGYKIGNNVRGILIIQIIFMFFTTYFLDKIATLELKNKKNSVLYVVITLFFLSVIYSGGNLVEEYCLPFLIATLYYNLKYINNYKTNNIVYHPLKYSFLYGISFGVCFLTRLTNSISICLGLFVILVILIKKKRILDIFKNLILFICGFAVISLPFVIYFCYHNIFFDFLYGTILYNFDYIIKSRFQFDGLLTYILCFAPSYLIFISSYIHFRKKDKYKGLLYLLLGLFESFLFISGLKYPHYAVISLPNLLILLVDFDNLVHKKTIRKVFFVLVGICFICSIIFNVMRINSSRNRSLTNYVDKLLKSIGEDGKKSLIVLNMNEYKQIYINNNIVPYYKYFNLQDWQASNSKSLKDDISKVFSEGNVEYILSVNPKESILYPVILERYDIVTSHNIDGDNIVLYIIKQ
ncbi:MAG: glycosyltransferase family 39 protein [Bacilli bacterium]|nr:glycosyltransferase family 39 protein [Bacilli bacterium]